MVSALKLLGTSIDRVWNPQDETIAKAGLQRTIDTSYPWLDDPDFPRRAIITEWFYNPLKGQPRFVDISRLRSLATCEWVTMCTNTIIEEVAQVPWEVVPKDPDLQESPPESIEAEIDEVEDFFNNPNPNKGETINTILRGFIRDSLELDAGLLVKGFSERSYDRSGSSYSLKPDGQRDLAELWARDGGTFLKDIDIYGVEKAYWQYSWNNPAGAPEAFDVDEVVYAVRNPRSYSPYGWAETQSSETILNLLINAVFSNATMFQEYAVPSGIVSFTGTEEEELRLRQYLRSEIKGRFHKVAVLNKDAKFVPLAYTAKDMDFLEGQKWFGRMIWAIYKLTPSELGYEDESIRATGKAMAAQGRVQKRKAVLPMLRMIEQIMNEQVLMEFSPNLLFRFHYADKEEQVAAAQLDMESVGSGLMTINEYRQKHEIGDKVSWGDEPLQMTLGKMQSQAAPGQELARRPGESGHEDLRRMTAEEKSLMHLAKSGNVKGFNVDGDSPVFAIDRKSGKAIRLFDSTLAVEDPRFLSQKKNGKEGRWITTDEGQHIFIGEGGDVKPEGPKGPAEDKLKPTEDKLKIEKPTTTFHLQRDHEEKDRLTVNVTGDMDPVAKKNVEEAWSSLPEPVRKNIKGINVTTEEGDKFKVGWEDKERIAAGHFDTETGIIQIWNVNENADTPFEIHRLVTHEAAHGVYHDLVDEGMKSEYEKTIPPEKAGSILAFGPGLRGHIVENPDLEGKTYEKVKDLNAEEAWSIAYGSYYKKVGVRRERGWDEDEYTHTTKLAEAVDSPRTQDDVKGATIWRAKLSDKNLATRKAHAQFHNATHKEGAMGKYAASYLNQDTGFLRKDRKYRYSLGLNENFAEGTRMFTSPIKEQRTHAMEKRPKTFRAWKKLMDVAGGS